MTNQSKAIFILTLFVLLLGMSITASNGWSQETAVQNENNSAAQQSDEYTERGTGVFMTLRGDKTKIDGATALMILFLGSYVLDRISTGVLSFAALKNDGYKDPNSLSFSDTGIKPEVATTNRFIVYYFTSCVAAMVLLFYFCHLEVLTALGIDGLYWWGDLILTGLIMVIGAERVAQWLQLPGSPGAQQTQPVVIAGELELKEPISVQPIPAGEDAKG